MTRRDVFPGKEHSEIKACGGKIGKAEYAGPDFNHIGGHGRFPLVCSDRIMPGQVMPPLIVVNRGPNWRAACLARPGDFGVALSSFP